MPYRNAWVFIAALIVATVLGFWPSYFAVLPASPVGFHIHGLTASLWMLLLFAQSWTTNRSQMATHRTLGKATFVAVPIFAAGAMGVMHSMAVGTVGGDPFYGLWGAPLGFIDAMAFGAFLYVTGMALRHRRSVRLHSGYMLSTALLLFSPVFGRLYNHYVPGLAIHGPKDFPIFGWAVQLANLTAALIALWLWRRDPKAGRPWAVALGVIVVQIVGFQTFANGSAWRALFVAVGTQPLAALMTVGFAAGVATIVAGWTAKAGQATRPAAA